MRNTYLRIIASNKTVISTKFLFILYSARALRTTTQYIITIYLVTYNVIRLQLPISISSIYLIHINLKDCQQGFNEELVFHNHIYSDLQGLSFDSLLFLPTAFLTNAFLTKRSEQSWSEVYKKCISDH